MSNIIFVLLIKILLITCLSTRWWSLTKWCSVETRDKNLFNTPKKAKTFLVQNWNYKRQQKKFEIFDLSALYRRKLKFQKLQILFLHRPCIWALRSSLLLRRNRRLGFLFLQISGGYRPWTQIPLGRELIRSVTLSLSLSILWFSCLREL